MTWGDRAVRLAGQLLLTVLVAEALTRGLLATGWRPGPRVPDLTTRTTDTLADRDGAPTPWSVDLVPESGHPWADRDDVRRIALVGDSFAHGLGVSAQARLGSQLALRLPTLDGAPVEVLQLATPGLDLPTEVVLYRDVGEAYAPDHVVWVFVLNDLGVRASGDHDLIAASVGTLPPSRSAVLAVVEHLRAQRRLTAQSIVAYRHALAPAALGPLTSGLASVVADLRARGADLTFVIFPLLHELSAYPFAAEHAAVAEALAPLGVDVLDLLPTFAGREAASLWVSARDHHPNATAHALAADALAAHLAASRRVSEAAARACPPAPAWPGDTPALAAAREGVCRDADAREAWEAWAAAIATAPDDGLALQREELATLGRVLADRAPHVERTEPPR